MVSAKVELLYPAGDVDRVVLELRFRLSNRKYEQLGKSLPLSYGLARLLPLASE